MLRTFPKALANEDGLHGSAGGDEAKESQCTWSLALCSGVSPSHHSVQLAGWHAVDAAPAVSKAHISYYSVQ